MVVPVEYASQDKKYGPSLGFIVSAPYLFQRGSCGAVTKHSANEVIHTTLLSGEESKNLDYKRSQRAEDVTTNTLILPHLPLELWHFIFKIMIAQPFSITQTP